MKWTPEQIKKGREARGLTQRQLAAEIGVAPRSIQAWESGETSPQGRHAGRLEQALPPVDTDPDASADVDSSALDIESLDDDTLWNELQRRFLIYRRNAARRTPERMSEQPPSHVLRDGKPPLNSAIPPEGHTETGG